MRLAVLIFVLVLGQASFVEAETRFVNLPGVLPNACFLKLMDQIHAAADKRKSLPRVEDYEWWEGHTPSQSAFNSYFEAIGNRVPAPPRGSKLRLLDFKYLKSLQSWDESSRIFMNFGSEFVAQEPRANGEAEQRLLKEAFRPKIANETMSVSAPAGFTNYESQIISGAMDSISAESSEELVDKMIDHFVRAEGKRPEIMVVSHVHPAAQFIHEDRTNSTPFNPNDAEAAALLSAKHPDILFLQRAVTPNGFFYEARFKAGHALSPQEFIKLPPGNAGPPLDPGQGELRYEIHGEHHPETLVLIHGLDSSRRTFDPIVQRLSEKYRVITYDQRGHGESALRGNDYSTKVMANDLKSLLDFLHVEKAHILGHSMGGRTAARFAQLFPERVRSVIVEDMEMRARAPADEAQLLVYREAAEKARLAFQSRTFPSERSLRKALEPFYGDGTDEILLRRTRKNPDGTVSLQIHPGASLLYGYQSNIADLGPALRSAGKPMLFIRAEPRESAMFEAGVEAIARDLPDAQMIKIPGAVHNVHGSRTDSYLALVTDFIDHGQISPATRERIEPRPAFQGPIELDPILAISDDKTRVAELTRIPGRSLTGAQVQALVSRAKRLSNSWEIAQYLRMAKESRDPQWMPVLDTWIEAWRNSSIQWQRIMRENANDILVGLKHASSEQR